MSNYDYDELQYQAEDLAEKIIKRYKSYGVYINIKNKNIYLRNDCFIYKTKILCGTRKNDIEKYAEDVRMSLKLPVLRIMEQNIFILIIVSKASVSNKNFLQILKCPEFESFKANRANIIPHIVGIDAIGKPVITDLVKYPHILVSGTTGSGKTTGLKNILLSILCNCPPNKVKLLICDKANEFDQFSDVPHLSAPIITDSKIFLNIMLKLKAELDNRLSIKNTEEFSHFPTIVCVADEFLSFLSEIGNKKMMNLAAETISAILRRGRHVKIHMVLAAHNPTQKNMLIDLSDIQSRMAFQCAKYNNSITILGESGAEKLKGNGDMLFRSSSNAQLQHIQGLFISEKTINKALTNIRINYKNRPPKDIERYNLFNKKYCFLTNTQDLTTQRTSVKFTNIVASNTNNEIDDQLFANIIIWALNKNHISCNMICDTFHIGWKRATGFIDKLHKLQITGDIYAKLPRTVLPVCLEDLSSETINFLNAHGKTIKTINQALTCKGGIKA
ncbi:FtsK/SpoIIIE domain-containing protein [Pectinatus brassicae]|uniref:DNA segregation ATPase FtsK/SpoIIIE-like protein n=1 Tax=Pectinatus brassicae TaxID=862415 RepID=A0A840URM6_9FIRM|nr:FtsK/SpoIIIE domain-containing protein [Pectinatus brassicae]MBB5337398.1 DNA segregation ATPase FtsK/SpoIIIE-like protein [Pectinatus brassicae]